ncbi:MAG: TolB family protein [Solirubrobacterales bacterium]
MQISRLTRALVASAVAAGLLILPAAAQALVYVKNPSHPTVFDSHRGRIDTGSNPRILAGGVSIAYMHEGPGHTPELKVILGSQPAKTVLTDWREPSFMDNYKELIAALRGPELGQRELVVVNIGTGAVTVLDKGYFTGLSFCPECAEPQLVYSKSPSERDLLHSDVYKVGVDGGAPVRLTSDHRSLDPLWRPGTLERARPAKIVFVKELGAKRRRYGPKNELFTMHADGSDVKHLTHTKVGPLLQGLFPTAFSNDGRHLLAEFEGQDTSYAVGVDFKTGRQHPIASVGERGFIGTAISNDGSAVLGYTGGFDPQAPHDVAVAPFTGGKPKVKVRNAFEPDWNR